MSTDFALFAELSLEYKIILPVSSSERKVPDQVWVQCDSCLKWRRLPDAITELPDKWFCSMNYDPQFRSCLVEEELEDEEEDQKSYPKPFKRQRRNTKSFLEENVPDSSQSQERPATQAPRHPPASVMSAEKSPLPLINLTVVSNSLRRAKQKFSSIETQMDVFPVLSLTPPQERSSQTHWPALNEERRPLTQSDILVSKAACGMMEETESHQVPAAAEEACERDSSSGTGREYSSAAEHIIELPLKNERKGVVHHEGHVDDEEEQEEEECNLAEVQRWQDELLELMNETAEERDACCQELHMLREHSAALEEERNQLISRLESVGEEKSRLSALCHRLRSQLSDLREHSQRGKEEKDDSSKLRMLRLNLSRLLLSFIPSLHLEHVDYSSDVIDTILTQVLEHIT